MRGQMDRRQIMGGISAAAALGLAPRVRAQKGRAAALPNIIFIMADDLGYADLGMTGSRNNKTPHIDSIARNGLFLRHGYANSSICSPTRTGLLTGCYQQRFRIGLEEPIGPTLPDDAVIPAERRTLPEVLRERGYETALVGKWHLGNPPQQGPLAHGYDHFFGISQGGADYFRHKTVAGGKDQGKGLFDGNTEVEREGYLTDLFGDEAVKRIKSKTKPLFLSLHFNAPHWPWEGREDIEVSRTLKDFFHYDGGNLETFSRMVSAMDDNVGKVLAALKAIGELDNTLIIFTSDNGGERFSDTWPFTGVKGELLEGGIRVPILAQWPKRIKAGSVSDQVMISMDFLPTLLTLAGGTVPAGEFDGVDLSAQLLGRAAPVERTLFWRMKAGAQAAIRQGNWKYLKLENKEHLFNIASDPRERVNLKDTDPKRFDVLKAAYDSWNSTMIPYPLRSYNENVKVRYPDRY
jgi:arylsulfatase A-like enzyme